MSDEHDRAGTKRAADTNAYDDFSAAVSSVTATSSIYEGRRSGVFNSQNLPPASSQGSQTMLSVNPSTVLPAAAHHQASHPLAAPQLSMVLSSSHHDLQPPTSVAAAPLESPSRLDSSLPLPAASLSRRVIGGGVNTRSQATEAAESRPASVMSTQLNVPTPTASTSVSGIGSKRSRAHANVESPGEDVGNRRNVAQTTSAATTTSGPMTMTVSLPSVAAPLPAAPTGHSSMATSMTSTAVIASGGAASGPTSLLVTPSVPFPAGTTVSSSTIPAPRLSLEDLQADDANRDPDIVVASAEIEYCGREIQSLVAGFVRRQIYRLRKQSIALRDERLRGLASEEEVKQQARAMLDDLEEAKNQEIGVLQQTIRELRGSLSASESMKACLQSENEIKATTIRTLQAQVSALEKRLMESNEAMASSITMKKAGGGGETPVAPAGRVLAPISQNATAGANFVKQLSSMRTPSASPPPRAPVQPARPVGSDFNVEDSPGSISQTVPPKVFVVTGFSGNERLAIESIVQRLGGTIAPPFPSDTLIPANITHVVAGQMTPKVVTAALTPGLVLVSRHYMMKCADAGTWLPYAPGDCVRGDQFRFSSKEVLVGSALDAGSREVVTVLKQLGIKVKPMTAESLLAAAALKDDLSVDNGSVTLQQLLDDVRPFFLKMANKAAVDMSGL